MKQALACFLMLLTSGLSLAAHHRQATANNNLVFTGVNVINTTGAQLQTDMTVVIRNGRIVGLGKTGKIATMTLIGELGMKKIIVCLAVLLCGGLTGLGTNLQAGESREEFWDRFRTAVIKKDRVTVSSLAQFPISMPYGYKTVRNKPQLIKRYRDVFNHEGDAAVCFAAAKPQTDPARPKEFTVGCKNAAGDEVVIYLFVLTKNGWRFNGLDNINE